MKSTAALQAAAAAAPGARPSGLWLDAFAVDTKGEDEVEAAIQALEERLRALPAAPEQPYWCF